MSTRVLVTDGEQRAALACVRSLGKAGFGCFVAGPEKGNLAGRSKFCRGVAVTPDPREDMQGFGDEILDRARAWDVDVVLPMTEKSLRALLPRRDAFGKVGIPFPDATTFFRVSDKSQVLSAADRIGLEVPGQWEYHSVEELNGAEIPAESFPLVLKPARSVSMVGEGGKEVGVRYANGPDELRAWASAAGPEHFPVLLQRRIVGHGAGVFVLVWGGKLRAVVGHHRIREKPPSGGVSVVRESTVVDPGLLDRTLLLLSELGWTDGVAMVEYKVEDPSGTPYLMEINGRFWGSLQLAIDAGVDFPALLLLCSSGSPPTELVVGSPGVRTRWLMGDLDHLLLRTFRGRDALNLPPGFPGRARGVTDFLLEFRPGVHLEVFKISDPRPFFGEIGAWLRALL